jgi:hypothetical protein
MHSPYTYIYLDDNVDVFRETFLLALECTYTFFFALMKQSLCCAFIIFPLHSLEHIIFIRCIHIAHPLFIMNTNAQRVHEWAKEFFMPSCFWIRKMCRLLLASWVIFARRENLCVICRKTACCPWPWTDFYWKKKIIFKIETELEN